MDPQDLPPMTDAAKQPNTAAPEQRQPSATPRWVSVTSVVLLMTIAAAPWIPAARTLVMIEQPAGVVACSIFFVAAILAAMAILRSAFLPRSVRIAGVAAAAYAAAAFAWAVRMHTTYAAAFQGHALWDKLPFWLQGPYLGAIAIPLGLAADLLGGRPAPGAGQRRHWHRQLALVSATSLLAAGVVVARAIEPPERAQQPAESAATRPAAPTAAGSVPSTASAGAEATVPIAGRPPATDVQPASNAAPIAPGAGAIASALGFGSTGAASAGPPAASLPAPASPPGAAVATSPSLSAATPGEPAGTDLALDDNGGDVERITDEYGSGFEGRRLIDGKPGPAWSWTRPSTSLPADVVISFYKHDTALVRAVALELAQPDAPDASPATVPKDIEIWASTSGVDSGFQKVAAATLMPRPSAQTIVFPPVEARYVKVRVLSLYGGVPIPPSDPVTIALGEIRVLEADGAGYSELLARHPDLSEWANSPRHAAQRAIEWLQPATVRWQRDNKCFGCHIQSQAVMGLAIAKKNDFIVSDRAVKDLIDYTRSQQQADGSYLREPDEPSTLFAAMGLAYSDDLEGVKSDPNLTKAADWLAAKQKPDGELPYGRSECGSGYAVVQGPIMATANTLIAFERAFAQTRDPRYRSAADRALSWIGAADPVTTQDKIFKVLALSRFGGESGRPLVERVVEQLMAEQDPSGGWRECEHTTLNKKPNVFSTGQVLYAFKQAGVSRNSSPFLRGVKYLLANQKADGSWPADDSAFFSRGAPYAPTMWAIIGLAGSYGQVKTGGLQITTSLSPEQAAARRNLEIILDLSGSMKLPLGRSTRIATARQALRDVLDKIPDDFNVGLRVYGNRYGSRQKETCTDTELAAPLVKLDRQKILSIANGLRPRGETPLVYSILKAPEDLKPVSGGSVIVITDGEESCGGDPVAAVQQLKQAGLPVTVNIVGFTLTGPKVEQQLTAFSEGTGGHYYSAKDGTALARAITMAALSKIPYTVYDAKGREVAKGFAGPLSEVLEPGPYKVVVHAGDQELTEMVTVTLGTDVVLKVGQRGDRFELVRVAGTD